jgi:hypothetical protein
MFKLMHLKSCFFPIVKESLKRKINKLTFSIIFFAATVSANPSSSSDTENEGGRAEGVLHVLGFF